MTFDASHWDERYSGAERIWSVEPNQFVAAALSELPPGRAVDLAAGEGRNAVWLASLGWDVTAVDFSGVAIGRGRDQDDTVTWVVGDVLTVPLPADLDLALISYLHLPHDEMEQVVRRAVAALAPGGTFFLVCHDASNPAEGVGGPQNPAVLVDAARVTGWLDDAEVVEAGRVERHVEAGTAYDVRVLATKI
ncbi:MAG: Methyltransferase type 12 [Nocardioidaceae bacterium]|nr:Methyltransferase type 12 [Nocardioidaceae bacterium]